MTELQAPQHLVSLESAQQNLEPKDASLLWNGLRDLYRASDMASFPAISLRLINRLISSQSSSYNEIDLCTGTARVFYEPDAVRKLAEEMKPRFWEFRHQHPLMARYEAGLDEGVHKISDFIREEDLIKTDLYREVLSKLGVIDCLSFVLESSSRFKIFFAINSDKIFTERDRAVAILLQPHLIQGFENAQAFTHAQALTLMDRRAHVVEGDYGVILAGQSGKIIYANPLGSEHLAAIFPGSLQEHLPGTIFQEILQSKEQSSLQPHLPLEIVREDKIYLIRFAQPDEGHWLLVTRCVQSDYILKRLVNSLELTERQCQVVLWLAHGKTNEEIGMILGLSDRTVAKHLQRIFERLGVENRHAAILQVLPHLS